MVRTHFKSFFYLLDLISQLSYLRERSWKNDLDSYKITVRNRIHNFSPNSSWDWNSPLSYNFNWSFCSHLKQNSLLFSVCGHWFSVLYTRWFKKLSLFSPCSFLYRTERGVDWEWVCFRVSLQILLRQVGTCLDKEMFKTRYSSKLWKRICIFNHLESGKWVWKLQIKLYLVQMWWECSCKLSFCCPLELTPGES